MRPTQILRGSGAPDPRYGHFLGDWGSFGGQKQKGIVYYGLSANRQNPFAGAGHDAIFNTFRRSKGQFLYVVPPFIGVYYLINYLVEKNEHLNSKAGRAETAAAGGDEE